jgi:hypothetical protein
VLTDPKKAGISAHSKSRSSTVSLHYQSSLPNPRFPQLAFLLPTFLRLTITDHSRRFSMHHAIVSRSRTGTATTAAQRVYKALLSSPSAGSVTFSQLHHPIKTASTQTRHFASLTKISPNLQHLSVRSIRSLPSSSTRSFSNSSAMSESVKEITTISGWKSALDVKDRLVVVDCYATWCPPCKAISPILEK